MSKADQSSMIKYAKNVLESVQNSEYIKKYWIVYFKRVRCITYELCLNKPVINYINFKSKISYIA